MFKTLYQEKVELDPSALKFESCAKILVSGQSGVGKSYFISDLISNRQKLFVDDFKNIVWICPANSVRLQQETFQKLQDLYPKILIHEGFLATPEILIPKTSSPSLIIFDDLYDTIVNSNEFLYFMTFVSRHNHFTVIISCQNIFSKGNYAVGIRRQLSHYVIFDTRNERNQFLLLGKSIFPEKSRLIMNCFEKLQDLDLGPSYNQYIVFDLSLKSKLPKSLRIFTSIFDEKWHFFIVH